MSRRIHGVLGAGLVALSCLAPDIEIVSTLGSGGSAGGANAGGTVGSGGSSNPASCPPELPPLAQFPCTQQGLTCDYGNTHCVCRQFLLECSMSGSGGAAGASSGGAGGSAGFAGSSAGQGGASGSSGSGGGGGSGGQGKACVEMVSDIWGDDAYLQYGNWFGYAFAAAEGPGTTIDPLDFDGWVAGSAPCACGTVSTGNGAAAGIGIFLNQPQGFDPQPVVVSGSGLVYDITHNGPYIRVELQALNVAPEQHWCFDAYEQSGVIPWVDFRTECATGTGVPFDLSADQITNVAFYFSSEMSTSSLDFNLCVSSIAAAP